MKAITLWQPWASLLASGAKQYETRSWATAYRGPIAIHAATRKCDTKDIPAFTVHKMIQALRPITSKLAKTTMYLPLELLPRGCIIATAEIVGCWEIGPVHNDEAVIYIPRDGASDIKRYIVGNEVLFGDWAPGCYAWEFANMTMLPEPIPAKGRQHIWNWTDELNSLGDQIRHR